MLSNDKFPWIPCVHSNPPWWNFHVLSAIVILLSELQYKFFLAKWLAHLAMSFRRGSLLSCYKWRGFQWHSNIQALAGVNLKPNWFYSAEAKLTFYLFQELSYVLLPSGRDPKMKQIKDVYLKTKIKVLVLWSWIIASHEKKNLFWHLLSVRICPYHVSYLLVLELWDFWKKIISMKHFGEKRKSHRRKQPQKTYKIFFSICLALIKSLARY